jgi:hypothetical protein
LCGQEGDYPTKGWDRGRQGRATGGDVIIRRGLLPARPATDFFGRETGYRHAKMI